MKLKQKSQMTGRELCDLEGIIFDVILDGGQTREAQMESFMKIIKTNGEEIVKLCYTKEDGAKIEEVNEPYRRKMLEDFPYIMEFIFETPKGDEAGKPKAQRIKRQ